MEDMVDMAVTVDSDGERDRNPVMPPLQSILPPLQLILPPLLPDQ
jgi:hypothetical protein